ncbi:MAG: hypothetical protein LC785_14265 [Acidobacteria bacterium]|nr:hypothetical protein [Acidobacteriota bacterium]MCA1643078.1 hypothetical protein [Acidobacteriota bacterium]
MSAETTSTNPVVRAIIGGTAPTQARMMAARGVLPLAAEDLLEVLVCLCGDGEPEIAQAAGATLAEQPAEVLLGAASSEATAPRVLSHLATLNGAARAVQEALALNARTPDEAIIALARGAGDGALLELIAVNQQRLIRAPAIIDALLSNPARTFEAERRATEVRQEFFEKERGARQIAEEMRARGLSAAAEFVESAESIGASSGLSFDDAWLLAEHIEVSDDELDDSWMPSERLEELLAESEEERAATLERIISETAAEIGEIAPDRVSLIRRIMLMSVKDRIKLGMKGDREARAILIRDGNKVVSTAVVHNPRITDKEVETIAAMRTISEDVLRQIAMNRAWGRVYPVIHNLARNPRTPLAAALGILPRLQGRDLLALSQNRNVPDGVRRQAFRLIQTRAGH